jgi:hypothetical protein
MAVLGLICLDNNVPGIENTMYAIGKLKDQHSQAGNALQNSLTDVEARQSQ